MNSGSIEVKGYWDNAAAANRYTSPNLGLRPGTSASGTVYCGFTAAVGFSCAVIVESITADLDSENQSKPSGFSASLVVNGAVTFPPSS